MLPQKLAKYKWIAWIDLEQLCANLIQVSRPLHTLPCRIRTLIFFKTLSLPLPSSQPPLLPFEDTLCKDIGHALPNMMPTNNDDVNEHVPVMYENFDEPKGPDTHAMQIWQQFLMDLIVKGLNPRSAREPSYIKLQPGDRMAIGEDLYKMLHLSTMFRIIWVEHNLVKAWQLVIESLFPPHDKPDSPK